MHLSPALHHLLVPYVVLPSFLLAQPVVGKPLTPFVAEQRAIGARGTYQPVYVAPLKLEKKSGPRSAGTYRANRRHAERVAKKEARKAERALLLKLGVIAA